MSDGILVRIEAPHFCAGFVIEDGKRTPRQCAPILWYMRSWPIEKIEAYCRKKGWTMTVMPIQGVPAVP